MKENKFNIILKEVPLSKEEYQKRVDEMGKLLYELYCQSRLKNSIHHGENNNNLPKESIQ